MISEGQKYIIGKSRVTLKIGSILDSASSVLVSSDDDHFTMRGGVSFVLSQAAGHGIRAELAGKIGKHDVGSVVVTSAGKLEKQEYIFHGVTRLRGTKPESKTEEETNVVIKQIVVTSIALLDKMGLNSIAFPAIGTGFAQFGPKEVAVAMARVLTEQLHSIKRGIDVEVFLFPDSFSKNVDFVDFFRQFDKASGWIEHVVRDHAVVFVHGIRTEAAWFDAAERIFRAYDHRLNPVAAGYGFFDLARFLLPFEWAKASAFRRVESKILAVSSNPNTAHVSVVAHSFGTYLVGQVLKNNPAIKLHRLILCGGVLSQEFEWELIRDQLSPVDDTNYPIQCVINECGWRDVWPIFAQTCTWGYGSSGRFGFQSPFIIDRFHDKSHSEFFVEDFVVEYWCNFISRGEVAMSPERRPRASWFLNLMTILKAPYIGVVLLGGAIAIYYL